MSSSAIHRNRPHADPGTSGVCDEPINATWYPSDLPLHSREKAEEGAC